MKTKTLTVIKCFVEEPSDAPHVMEFVGETINECLTVCNVYVENCEPGTTVHYHSHEVVSEKEYNKKIGESRR